MNYKIESNNTIKNVTTSAVFSKIDTLLEYEEYKKWLANGNTPTPEFSASEILVNAKELKINELKTTFLGSLSTCFTCSNNIKMDATESAVAKFEKGLSLATDLNESTVYIIDFHNVKHVNISLADAKIMILEIAKNTRTHHEDFNDKRILVMNAETVEAVNLI